MKAFRPTHKGLFCGVVPVFLDMTDPECPGIVERHWSLWPLLEIVEAVLSVCIAARSLFDPTYEPAFPIMITGELE